MANTLPPDYYINAINNICVGYKESHGITRRIIIKTITGGAVVGAVGTGAVSADRHVDTTVTIDNVGAGAWKVTSVSGGDVEVNTGSENSPITLTSIGARYQFNNRGGSAHPLAFRDESGNVLLSQSSSGSFEDDSAVSWVNNGDSVEFTLTDDLASQLAEYYCTIHTANMVGSVDVDQSSVDYTPATGSVSVISPDDGATVTSPVSVEMAAENFTIESAENGVSDGAGHLHILVDQPAVEPGEVIPNNPSNGYYHYGDGSTAAEIELEPEEHTVRVQAGTAIHRAYDLIDSVDITVSQSAETTIDINNVGAGAWEIKNISGGGANSATGVENPEITFTSTGTRYRFNNGGYSAHPLAFRDESGNVLLSQSGSGSFVGDSAVNWVDTGDSVAFTLTDKLASELSEYICTIHTANMLGFVTVETTTEPSISDYTNGAEIVETSGLLDAINDWRDDEIDTPLLLDVIGAWRSGATVS